MNPKIKKVIDEIDRTKAKILELQTLLPELERKRIDMENTEIIKLVRSADILPAELPAFIESLKNPKSPAPAYDGVTDSPESTITNPLGNPAFADEQDDDDYPDDEDNFNAEPLSED